MAAHGVCAGVLEESSGKFCEIAGKFTEFRNALILGFRAPGKADLPQTSGAHTWTLCRPAVWGVFRKRQLQLQPFNPPRGVLGPFGPKVGNGVENEFLGPSGPGVQRVKNGVEKESKSGNFKFFSTSLTLFRLCF